MPKKRARYFMTNPNNPPVFPHPSGAQGCEGMTLRDYFAGQALAGFLSSPNYTTNVDAALLSTRCGMVAEAMLAEREGGKAHG